jgi:DNA-binding response OmpR family regulator/HPt (histidine-containing phosphotransfer) domain-containing protein
MRILLVDDDEALMESLAERLIHRRYAVDIAVDGGSAQTYVDLFNYDLIVLDLMLPDGDGIQFCQKFRSMGFVNPVMILTARGSTAEKIKALDAGADDYVVKPFDFDELCARIRALLRRDYQELPSVLQWGPLRLDPSTYETTYQQQPVRLTPKEFSMVELFLRHPHRVYSLGSIIDDLWSFEDPPGEDAIRTHIKGLRRKLKAAGAPKDLIQTVYGLGYRLNENIPWPVENLSLSANGSAAETAVTTALATPSDKLVAEAIARSRPAQAEPVAVEPFAKSALHTIHQTCQRYLAIAHQQTHVLEEAAEALAQGTLDPQLRYSSRVNAHKLAGSLGSFGMAEGSQIAHQLEAQLEAMEQMLEPASRNGAVQHGTVQLHAAPQNGAQLESAHLDSAHLDSAQLNGAQLDNAHLNGAANIQPLQQTIAKLVRQLRQRIDKATVPACAQAISASVSAGMPLLLIVSEDEALIQQLTQAAAAANLRTQAAATPQATAAIFNFANDANAPLGTHSATHSATQSGAQADSGTVRLPDLLLLDITAHESAFAALIRRVKQDYALPVVVLEQQLALPSRLDLVKQGVELLTNRSAAASQIIEVAAQAIRSSTSKVRVALADDDPDKRSLLKTSLKSWGFQLTTFESAASLWQWLNAATAAVDVLILDIEMPEMSGIELCRVLRADARFQSLPILFLSAHSEESLRIQAFQAGADDFINKSVGLAELATRLRNQLARACLR